MFNTPFCNLGLPDHQLFSAWSNSWMSPELKVIQWDIRARIVQGNMIFECFTYSLFNNVSLAPFKTVQHIIHDSTWRPEVDITKKYKDAHGTTSYSAPRWQWRQPGYKSMGRAPDQRGVRMKVTRDSKRSSKQKLEGGLEGNHKTAMSFYITPKSIWWFLHRSHTYRSRAVSHIGAERSPASEQSGLPHRSRAVSMKISTLLKDSLDDILQCMYKTTGTAIRSVVRNVLRKLCSIRGAKRRWMRFSTITSRTTSTSAGAPTT